MIISNKKYITNKEKFCIFLFWESNIWEFPNFIYLLTKKKDNKKNCIYYIQMLILLNSLLILTFFFFNILNLTLNIAFSIYSA